VRSLFFAQKLQEEGQARRNQQEIDTVAELNDIQQNANELAQQHELYREKIKSESQERRANLIAENERNQILIKEFEAARQLKLRQRDTVSQFPEADADEQARHHENAVDEKVPSSVAADLEGQADVIDNYSGEAPQFPTPKNPILKYMYILVGIVLLIIIIIVFAWAILYSMASMCSEPMNPTTRRTQRPGTNCDF